MISRRAANCMRLCIALICYWILIGIQQQVEAQESSPQELLVQVQLDERIYHVAWSPDGQLLAIASDSGARIYTDNLQQIALLQGHTPSNSIGWLAWSPDGTQLITIVPDDPVARIWARNVATNTFTQAITLPSNDPIYEGIRSASWSPDGTKLALVRLHQPEGFLGVLGVVQIYNTQTWQIENTLSEEFDFPAKVVEWSPDSSKIASAYYTCDTPDSIQDCRNPTFYVADVNTGQILWRQEDLVVTYDLSWRDNKLAIGASGIYVYDPSTGQRFQKWDIDGPNVDLALYMHWNSNATRLIVANADGLVDVLDGTTGSQLLSFQAIDFPEGVESIDLSPDDTKLVIGSSVVPDQLINQSLIQVWTINTTISTPPPTSTAISDER